jgi:hypothetical protein
MDYICKFNAIGRKYQLCVFTPLKDSQKIERIDYVLDGCRIALHFDPKGNERIGEDIEEALLSTYKSFDLKKPVQ